MKNGDFEKFGMAALIPGMQHMIDLMQEELDKMRGLINEDGRKIPTVKIRKKSSKMVEYWRKMTPEQRSAEVMRRMKVRVKNKKAVA